MRRPSALKARGGARPRLKHKASTELVEANENLLLAALRERDLLEQAHANVKLRDHVLAVVSHDLTTPLAAVRLTCETLLANGAPKGLTRPLQNIRVAAEQMRHLIQELVELAGIHEGRLLLEPSVEPVRGLVDEVFAVLDPLREERGLRFSFKQPKKGLHVFCDRRRVNRVLMNLVGNAVKFSTKGGAIVLRARKQGGNVTFEVRDTGPGIRPRELAHLFDPGWKGARTGREGTRLGLYIARGIVEAHGGRIWATSTVGRGSVFSFTLPVAPSR